MILFGKKVGCTSLKDSVTGKLVCSTVLQIYDAVVIGKKTADKDGYSALVVGVGSRREDKVPKPVKGQVKKAGVELNPQKVKEIKVDAKQLEEFSIGDMIDFTNYLSENDKVQISAVTKGKGFQGAIKRWGFSRGRETHGSNHHRKPGSIGMREFPGEVMKGKKMPGRMGSDRKTIRGLKVMKITDDLLALKGAVPGSNKTFVEIGK